MGTKPSSPSRDELEIAEAAFKALLDAVDWQIAVARADGKIIYANRNSETRLTPALGELTGSADGPVESIARAVEGAQVRWLPAVNGERYALIWCPLEGAGALTPLERAQQMWSLTPRQRDVLCLLAEGKSNRAIARMLSCSERTVELHVASLFRKSGCDSRTALVAKFWRSQP